MVKQKRMPRKAKPPAKKLHSAPDQKLGTLLLRLDSGEKLAAAAAEYIAFFDKCAESPKVNAVRRRVQELIKVVRG